MSSGPHFPATAPIFNPGTTRIDPVQYKTGGSGDWPFQFTMPGLVNYTDTSPAIKVKTSKTLTSMAVEFNTNPTSGISLQIVVNGSAVHTQSGITGDTEVTISEPIVAGDKIQIAVSNIGVGDGDAMWVGLR